MIQNMDDKNKKHKSCRHSGIQAPIHHNTNSHKSKHNSRSGHQTNTSTTRRDQNQHRRQRKTTTQATSICFHKVAKNFNEKEVEKPSQILRNATTQERVLITNTTQWMQKQHITFELTIIRPNSKDKVVESLNITNKHPHTMFQ